MNYSLNPIPPPPSGGPGAIWPTQFGNMHPDDYYNYYGHTRQQRADGMTREYQVWDGNNPNPQIYPAGTFNGAPSNVVATVQSQTQGVNSNVFWHVYINNNGQTFEEASNQWEKIFQTAGDPDPERAALETILNNIKCTCPDHVNRNKICKHMILIRDSLLKDDN